MIAIGDIHGNFDKLLRNIIRYDLHDEILIQIGDFGIGFDPIMVELIKLVNIDLELEKRNCKLYIIRGNHDNPSFWEKNRITDLKYITFIEDYSILDIEGKNVLFIGGGISIDRKKRKRDVSYWYHENIKPNLEFMKSLKNNSIDVLITHTPITKIFQYKLTTDLEYYTSKDSFLIEDLKEEQDLLNEYNNILLSTQKDSLKYWVSGHLHIDALQIINDIKYKVVNIDDFYEIKF